ncbi:amidohydrolase [Microbacterium sp. NPDC078428]|uniref:amidohydrolase n=1 Tax=Microbacterium sp. NPDC078428 TaxID=3364190 RepID=UPI0037C51364
MYENGTIYDPDHEHQAGTALLVQGDRIRAIGSAEDLASAATSRIDLDGATLYPGFVDAHAHFIDTGAMTSRVDLGGAGSVNEVMGRLHGGRATATDGWLHSGNLDENFLIERRLPTIVELDSIGGGMPLHINHRSYHWTLVNTAGLAALDLPSDMRGIGRDGAGNPTGLLDKDANALAKKRVAEIVPDRVIDAAITSAAELAARAGLTSVHCIEGGDEYGGRRFVERLQTRDDLTFEATIYFNTTEPSEAAALGLRQVGGDITVDGSISNWTAAFLGGYEDRTGEEGHLYYSSNELEAMIESAHILGLQIGLHAIGDRAIDQALTAFEAVLGRHPARDHRHRIEHFGLPRPRDIARARELGLVITVQPGFMFQKLPTYRTRLGARSDKLYPLRTMYEAGVALAGSSDSMVSPFDPLFGIAAAVNGPVPSERIGIRAAIDLYTRGGAYAGFREHEVGALKPGMYADFAVLDRDLRLVEPSEITDTQVMRTVFRGRSVFVRE